MSAARDWAYEELREKMVAELPPRKRGEVEDPRIEKLRAALRRGEGSGSDAWEGALGVLDDLVDGVSPNEFALDSHAKEPARYTQAAARYKGERNT